MATARKRSRSDMQQPASPSSHTLADDNTYRMMVLRLDGPEEELDRHFSQKATELGINVPQGPKAALNLITHEVSTLHLAPSASDSPEHSNEPPPHTSQSIHTPSNSSIESPWHQKTPSLAATSVTSAPSTNSTSSHKSNYTKFKKGFRRISNIRRKKTLTPPSPEQPLRPSTSHFTTPELHPHFHPDDQIVTLSHSDPDVMTTEALAVIRPPGRTKITSISQADPTPPPPPARPQSTTAPPPPSPPPPPPLRSSPAPSPSTLERRPTSPPLTSTDPAGINPSLCNPTLKKLRTTQLQEQLRFISYRASQTRLLRTKHLQSKNDNLTRHRQAQTEAETRHSDALTNIEQQHLVAEVDLIKTLETEKQACEVRLKHMQAYCNPREHIEGMPKRVITRSDYEKLEQQYHVINGMENLHGSRINVLREKQAKQLERILGKQEQEIETLASNFEQANMDLDQKHETQERNLNREFAERKQRLIARWQMAEAIERRQLELETGEDYGPLPAIEWGDEGRDVAEEEEEMERIIAMKRISVDPETGIMIMECSDDGEGGTDEDEGFDESDMI